MFIEKLKESDVEKLIQEIDNQKRYKILSLNFWDIDAFSKWVVKLERIDDQRQCSIYFSDFNITTSFLGITQTGFKTAMYHMFGEEYKQAFNDNLRKKYEQELIK
ncbi:MAG: hypothetical protein IJW25_02655 [Clostridia bacterium]|nr:hypothetical protein [Clostridia bacterium]